MRARAAPHVGGTARVLCKRAYRPRKSHTVALGTSQAGARLGESASDLAIRITDENGRPTGSRNAIVLARHDQTFKLRPERDQMNIRHR
jgi:hypothetical protein